MSKEWDVLVASGNFEHRRSLIKILEELPLNVISVSTFQQAEEVLSRQHISLLFSDQRLADGSYKQLLNHPQPAGQTPRSAGTRRRRAGRGGRRSGRGSCPRRTRWRCGSCRTPRRTGGSGPRARKTPRGARRTGGSAGDDRAVRLPFKLVPLKTRTGRVFSANDCRNCELPLPHLH